MKKLLVVLMPLFFVLQAVGENRYYPAGTTWTEIRGWCPPDTTTYEVKGEVEINGLTYNEVYADGEPYCFLREEGPLVYIWINEDKNGLLYDFDWWEGKDYVACEWAGEDTIHVTMTNIGEITLMDGNVYQVWKQPHFGQLRDIICGIGSTASVLHYYEPATTGGGNYTLIEFTRDVQLYGDGIDALENITENDRQYQTRSIRLKRNEAGGYDLQMRGPDGLWQLVK